MKLKIISIFIKFQCIVYVDENLSSTKVLGAVKTTSPPYDIFEFSKRCKTGVLQQSGVHLSY